ncbi:MAG: sugar ABC transporter substrate-binding protein [Actinomycetota bacterium]
MKRLVGLVGLLLVIAMIATACSSSDEAEDTTTTAATETTVAAEEGIVIAFPIPGPAPYIDGYFENWDTLAAEAGVETIKTTGDWTPTLQAEQIDSLLAQEPDVFVIWAVDNNAILPSLARIQDAGIPVVATNALLGDEAFQYLAGYTGPDDVLQGEIAGKNMVEALGAGKVGMVRGTPGTAAHDNRADGFAKGIEGSDIELVDDQSGAWGDVQLTYDIVSAMLQKDAEITGIFVQDDGMGQGAAQAGADAGIDLVIVGIGGSCGAKELIADGKLAATTVQDPWEDARVAFEAAVKVAKGEQIAEKEFLEPPVVTKENVDSFECHF